MSPGELRTVHANPWFEVQHQDDPDTAGGRGWYSVKRSHSAVVVPVLPDGRLVLVHGTRRTTGAEARFELPAGGIGDGEPAEAAAVRELAEETGYRAGRVTRVGAFVEAPGISSAQCFVFECTDLVRFDQELEPGENWVPRPFSVDEVERLVTTGRIIDGSTLAALLLHRMRCS